MLINLDMGMDNMVINSKKGISAMRTVAVALMMLLAVVLLASPVEAQVGVHNLHFSPVYEQRYINTEGVPAYRQLLTVYDESDDPLTGKDIIIDSPYTFNITQNRDVTGLYIPVVYINETYDPAGSNAVNRINSAYNPPTATSPTAKYTFSIDLSACIDDSIHHIFIGAQRVPYKLITENGQTPVTFEANKYYQINASGSGFDLLAEEPALWADWEHNWSLFYMADSEVAAEDIKTYAAFDVMEGNYSFDTTSITLSGGATTFVLDTTGITPKINDVQLSALNTNGELNGSYSLDSKVTVNTLEAFRLGLDPMILEPASGNPIALTGSGTDLTLYLKDSSVTLKGASLSPQGFAGIKAAAGTTFTLEELSVYSSLTVSGGEGADAIGEDKGVDAAASIVINGVETATVGGQERKGILNFNAGQGGYDLGGAQISYNAGSNDEILPSGRIVDKALISWENSRNVSGTVVKKNYLEGSKTIENYTYEASMTKIVFDILNYLVYENPSDLVYSDSPKVPSVTFTEDIAQKFFEGCNISITYQDAKGNLSAEAPVNAGLYVVWANVTEGTYFKNSTNIKGSFQITKAPLTITADNQSITYGSAAPAYTVSIRGFKGNDNVSDLEGSLICTCIYITGSNAGTYPIRPSGLNSSNYLITYRTGSLTVTSRSSIGSTTIVSPTAAQLAAATNRGFNDIILAVNVGQTLDLATIDWTKTPSGNITFRVILGSDYADLEGVKLTGNKTGIVILRAIVPAKDTDFDGVYDLTAMAKDFEIYVLDVNETITTAEGKEQGYDLLEVKTGEARYENVYVDDVTLYAKDVTDTIGAMDKTKLDSNKPLSPANEPALYFTLNVVRNNALLEGIYLDHDMEIVMPFDVQPDYTYQIIHIDENDKSELITDVTPDFEKQTLTFLTDSFHNFEVIKMVSLPEEQQQNTPAAKLIIPIAFGAGSIAIVADTWYLTNRKKRQRKSLLSEDD